MKVFGIKERRTSKRTRANPKQKTKGPARSASSIIFAEGLLNGFNTVRDLARICDGLIPISICVQMGVEKSVEVREET